MISRPAIATLGCRACRNTIFRAVLGSAAPSIRTLAAQPPKPFPSSARRLLSSERQLGAGVQRDDAQTAAASSERQVPDETEDAEGTPWFLEEEPPRHPASLHTPNLPKAPEDAPSLLEPMIKYIYEDMGLDDLSLLDLRDLDTPAALGPNLIMLFGTARSERHLHVSSGRFVRWLRRNYKVDANAGGLIGPGELKTKLRRLRKKAKLMGTNTMILPGGDNGISTGWVCVNFSTTGDESNEAGTFDESGRFSGFGAAQTGTTIVVQCMTESRRSELDLESLWQGILKRSLEKERKLKGESLEDKAEIDRLVSSKVQLPTSPAALQWQRLHQASQQQRHFSTSMRRLQAQAGNRQVHGGTTRQQADAEPTGAETQHDLSRLRRQIQELQVGGIPLNKQVLENLISAVFQAAPPTPDSATERLALVDQLLLTAHERGMKVLSKDMVVTLIESLVSSPAYGAELQRSQKNMELLLVEMQSALDDNQTLRLMSAYANRQDWDRFWDAFRSPPRFNMPRSRDQYELVYRVMATTGDSKLCTEGLRWVYPEMLKEEPPVLPTGALYSALKACILTADPAAEELLHNPPPSESLDLVGRRRLQRREFVRVLKEVEDLRRHHVGTQAREQRAEALNRFSDAGSPRPE